MMESLRSAFDGLSRREKILVSVAGALTTIVIIVFLIAMPLLDGINNKQKEYIAALERRAQLEVHIAAMQGAKAVRYDSSSPLQTLISQSAAEAGFALDRVDAPSAGTVDIAMAQARPQALMAWLNDWEARGVSVQKIDIKAANNGTVSVTASLKRPGG